MVVMLLLLLLGVLRWMHAAQAQHAPAQRSYESLIASAQPFDDARDDDLQAALKASEQEAQPQLMRAMCAPAQARFAPQQQLSQVAHHGVRHGAATKGGKGKGAATKGGKGKGYVNSHGAATKGSYHGNSNKTETVPPEEQVFVLTTACTDIVLSIATAIAISITFSVQPLTSVCRRAPISSILPAFQL